MPARLLRGPGVANREMEGWKRVPYDLRTLLLHFKNPPHPLLLGDGGTRSDASRWHHLP